MNKQSICYIPFIITDSIEKVNVFIEMKMAENDVYYRCCGDNALTALKRDTFINWLKNNQKKFGISYDTNIIDERGSRVRGFKGIKTIVKLTATLGV